jgi:hypothetical protein
MESNAALLQIELIRISTIHRDRVFSPILILLEQSAIGCLTSTCILISAISASLSTTAALVMSTLYSLFERCSTSTGCLIFAAISTTTWMQQ